jgi:hypothetical protein
MKFTKKELKEAFDYLETLKDSGQTNMFGARPYVADEFGWDKYKAGKALSLWMAVYGPDTAAKDMVTKAMEMLKKETV